MALRGKKPKDIQKRLKAFFYGSAGAGKTTAAISFPNPYVIDTERGAENDSYVEIINKRNGAVFSTTSFDELIAEVKSLLTEKHDYKTLVIDPLTIIYNGLVDDAERRLSVGGRDGTEFGRHISAANKSIKRLLNLLLRLDMNVIITSHAKNEYSGADMKVTGQTFDCYKKLDYLFDLALEIQKRGKDRVAVIRKTRIKSFPDGDIFPFSYEEIAKRYGKDILEKDATMEELALQEQVDELNNLVDLMRYDEAVVSKWLEKTESSCFEEMKQSDIQYYIDEIKKRFNAKQTLTNQ